MKRTEAVRLTTGWSGRPGELLDQPVFAHRPAEEPRAWIIGCHAALILTALVVMASCAVFAGWEGRGGSASAGKFLPTDTAGLNLNTASTEPPPGELSPVTLVVLDQEVSPEAVEPEPQGQAYIEPAPVLQDFTLQEQPLVEDVAVPPVLANAKIEEPDIILTWHPGGSSMTPNWRMLGLPIALTAALAAAPVQAGPIENPPPADNRIDQAFVDLKKISDELDKVKQDQVDGKVNVAKLQERINSLSEQVNGISKQLTSLEQAVQNLSRPLPVAGGGDPSRDLADIKNQMEQNRQAMQTLMADVQRLQTQYSTSLRPTQPSDTGKLMLINRYPEAMDVVVNQNVYRLLPNETRELALPAGTFSYWIPKAQTSTQTRTLAPNNVFRITVQ